MRTKRTYYEEILHYVCPVCKAHVKNSEANYNKWGKRCEECYQQDRTVIYPFTSYTAVYTAIMQGKILEYKVAENFYMLGQLITVGIGQAKQQFPALTNQHSQPICYGEKEVKASIRRTYPQMWRERKEQPDA